MANANLFLVLSASPNGSSNPTLGPIGPSQFVAQLHVGVIAAVTSVVAIVFAAVYVQLILILCYGYKLFSYQTVFLFNILLWSSLRLVLYSFYFYHCCELVNNLPAPLGWLLVSAPSIFLFISLALLIHYFMEHLIKVVERRQEVFTLNPSYRRIHWYRIIGTSLWIISLVLFITVNIVLGIFIELKITVTDHITFSLRIPRVIVLESLLLIMGLVLGVFIIVIYTTRAGKDLMESKQVSKLQAIIISSLLILLFSSRAIYNIVAVALQSSNIQPFGYSNKFATDMADFDHNSKEGDIIYFCVLLLWEVIPICLIVLFFRVRRRTSFRLLNSQSMDVDVHSKYYFDNISDQRSVHTSLLRSSRVSIPNLPSQLHQQPSCSSRPKAGYGSTHYSAPSKYSINGNTFMPGTTPPQLFTGSPTVFHEVPTLNN